MNDEIHLAKRLYCLNQCTDNAWLVCVLAMSCTFHGPEVSITALQMLNEQMRKVWADDPTLKASMLSQDISGAFDNSLHNRLIYRIPEARLSQRVVE
jgi:hypothetical protein